MLPAVIVLAGGLGTRLAGVVPDKPKCLADINGHPFLYYLCQEIQKFPVQQVIFSVGFRSEMVKEYMNANAEAFTFRFSFAEEDKPLGTGGAILNALQEAQTEDVFVMNGDTLFKVDLNALYSFQQETKSDCTLALKPMKVADRYGLVQLHSDQSIIGFEEKKVGSSGLINGGVYCVYRKAFEAIPFPEVFSFEKEYLEKFITERNFYGFVQDNYFIDIGIPEDYEKAKTDFQLFDR